LLSVVLLTLNEERQIRDCLRSVRGFAGELLVFDSGSQDRTVEWARAEGARVEKRPFDNYAAQRNAALDAAAGEWVFFIDADERADSAFGSELKNEISRIQSTMPDVTLFWVPRKNIIFGKWIAHTGWSPDYQPRVLKKGRAAFDPGRPVHELVVTQGRALCLKHPILHYNYETVAQFRVKQERYTQLEAGEWYAAGRRARWRGFVGQPLREFFRRFVTLQGYRDGAHGLVLSSLMAYYAFRRQVLLARLGRGYHG
jgi:glycosyltransferase involved in cell wall biosynthesis